MQQMRLQQMNLATVKENHIGETFDFHTPRNEDQDSISEGDSSFAGAAPTWFGTGWKPTSTNKRVTRNKTITKTDTQGKGNRWMHISPTSGIFKTQNLEKAVWGKLQVYLEDQVRPSHGSHKLSKRSPLRTFCRQRRLWDFRREIRRRLDRHSRWGVFARSRNNRRSGRQRKQNDQWQPKCFHDLWTLQELRNRRSNLKVQWSLQRGAKRRQCQSIHNRRGDDPSWLGKDTRYVVLSTRSPRDVNDMSQSSCKPGQILCTRTPGQSSQYWICQCRLVRSI